MEPTLTQNCALYYAQHKTSKGRAALFKKFRAAARKQEAGCSAAADLRRLIHRTTTS